MRGIDRLRSVERSTGPLAQALPELPKIETVLIRLIRIAAYGMGDYFSQVFRGLGLTEITYHVLCILVASKDGRAAPSELSELIGTSRANMTKALAVLEKEGYVIREADKTDGRRSLIILSEAGRATVNKVTPSMTAPVADAFSQLSSDEQKILDKLLRKAIVSFDQAKINSDPIL